MGDVEEGCCGGHSGCGLGFVVVWWFRNLKRKRLGMCWKQVNTKIFCRTGSECVCGSSK